VRFGWSENIKAVAIIPKFELSTAKAREVLPDQYSRKDVVCCCCCFNHRPILFIIVVVVLLPS